LSSAITIGAWLSTGWQGSTVTLQREAVRDGTVLYWLWTIIGLGVAVRVGAAIYLGNSVTPLPGVFDQVSYHTLALRVLDGHGFSFGEGWWPATQANQPTAHWSFLYTGFLAAVYAVSGANPLVGRLVQAVVVGVLQPLFTYRIGNRLFGQTVGLVSSAIVACYAYFIYYSGALVTESLFIVALLWALDAAIRLPDPPRGKSRWAGLSGWLELGAAFGAAVLLRQVVILVVPLVVAWICRRTRVANALGTGGVRPSASWLVSGVATTALTIVLCVAPWTVRNWSVFHELVPLNTNAGFAFYWGNHPVHGNGFVPILPGPEYGRLIPSELEGLNEARLDRALMRRGFQLVASAPIRFLRVSVSRVPEYVKFWPSRDSGAFSNWARVLSFGLCLPFMVSGLWLALRDKEARRSPRPAARSAILLILGVASLYSLVHLLTWTLIRYRLPVDAILMPFAGLSVAWALDRLRRTIGQARQVSRPAGLLL
jgi:4-amino-4-deoxy-L-arabinose transferase-like glycosyltransferase